MSGDALGRVAASLDPGMVIVTTAVDGELGGCLVGFHCQCSISPPRYAVWLSKANHTYRLARRAPTLAVHFLGRGQHGLAEQFGGLTGDRVDKLERSQWDEGPDGVPLLRACPNRIVGRRTAMLDEGGDHVCFVLDLSLTELPEPFTALRLSEVADIEPGHGPEERPLPPTGRAG